MQFFNAHTHTHTHQIEVLELVNQYPMEFDSAIPFYSIGIHPWYIVEERLEADLEIIENKLQESNCLAIGECGLDKRIKIPMELQQLAFEKQLLLAEKYQKSVVIHCVAAVQEVIATKKKLQITVPMMIHGFSKNRQLAQQLLDNGFYISFGKHLLQKPELEAAFLSVPSNRIFLETDTLEEGIQTIYALAAKYKGISVEEMKQQINKNLKDVFKI
jgi:TatD DNase family protein